MAPLGVLVYENLMYTLKQCQGRFWGLVFFSALFQTNVLSSQLIDGSCLLSIQICPVYQHFFPHILGDLISRQ